MIMVFFFLLLYHNICQDGNLSLSFPGSSFFLEENIGFVMISLFEVLKHLKPLCVGLKNKALGMDREVISCNDRLDCLN